MCAVRLQTDRDLKTVRSINIKSDAKNIAFLIKDRYRCASINLCEFTYIDLHMNANYRFTPTVIDVYTTRETRIKIPYRVKYDYETVSLSFDWNGMGGDKELEFIIEKKLLSIMVNTPKYLNFILPRPIGR